jgi:uncharacterized membrane protein YhaH (DUF805 family)
MDSRSTVLPSHSEKRTSFNEGRRRRSPFWEVQLVFLLVVAITLRGPRHFIAGFLLKGGNEVNSSLRGPTSPIEAAHGAVASEQVLCSKIGVEVLKDDGNAVDAAVATTFCIGVVNMFS